MISVYSVGLTTAFLYLTVDGTKRPACSWVMQTAVVVTVSHSINGTVISHLLKAVSYLKRVFIRFTHSIHVRPVSSLYFPGS